MTEWATLGALVVSIVSVVIVVATRKKPLYVVKTHIGSHYPAGSTIHFDRVHTTISAYNSGLGDIDIQHVCVSIRWNWTQRLLAKIFRIKLPGSIDGFMYLPDGLRLGDSPSRLRSGSRLSWNVPVSLVAQHAASLGKISRFRARIELADGRVLWSKRLYPSGKLPEGVE